MSRFRLRLTSGGLCECWVEDALPAMMSCLQKDEDPVVIAKRLTMSIYRRNGGSAGGFNRPLRYPTRGLA
jgi:hypothetical protein